MHRKRIWGKKHAANHIFAPPRLVAFVKGGDDSSLILQRLLHASAHQQRWWKESACPHEVLWSLAQI